MNYFNFDENLLLEKAREYSKSYQSAQPFASGSWNNFFNPEVVEDILAEFPDLSKTDAIKFDDAYQKKLAGKGESLFGPKTKAFLHYLNSEPFLQFLQVLTGIEEKLIPDPYFEGGGLHEIKRGGLLKVHADFNVHFDLKLDRRINVLLYLNKDWEESYGGHFELWDQEMKQCVNKVLPTFNTMAIFSTTDFSYHGHPDPLNCPEHMSRKSLALYYYSNGRPAHEINAEIAEHNTIFRVRKGGDKDMMKAKAKDFVKDLIPPAVYRLIKK